VATTNLFYYLIKNSIKEKRLGLVKKEIWAY
jgi:hypothetical protein